MFRVLVFGITENPGGVESFLMNYYRHIDRKKISFDFLCNTKKKVAYEDEITSLGGRIFNITARSQNRDLYKYELRNFFEKYACEFDAIWVNVSSLANIDYLKLAAEFKIKKRIIHSHNSMNMDTKLRGLLHLAGKMTINKYATDFWACSESAAKWFYNPHIMPRVKIINNAVDLDRSKFNLSKRCLGRTYLNNISNIDDNTFIIGNVGRLHFQKNQDFAIEVFNQYKKFDNNSKLVLTGQGDDEEKLRRCVSSLSLDNDVIFTGLSRDMQETLSSFDVFLFPSLFEGLSISNLEAQVNGLNVVASTGACPDEIMINPNITRLSLKRTPHEWAKMIYKLKKNKSNYFRLPFDKVKNNFIEKHYEINREAKRLESLLLK